ncbi:MAG: cell wall hydrolase [Pseudolabrys sp.]|nr:cell wall hydrolase [Pseudolabrys sp.]MDP2297464.1 cell wall hydrolase [Pseudolabrys sp.]
MLTRSIDADPFGLTFEEKIFRNGKRVCVVFAFAAVGISALDLMNVRVVEAGAAFIRDTRLNYAEAPGRILGAIRQISIVPDQSVTVAIPRDPAIKEAKIAALKPEVTKPEATKPEAPVAKPAAAPAPKIAAAPVPAARIASAPPPPAMPFNAVMRSDSSPVAELAAARHVDAVELAMVSTAVFERPSRAVFGMSTPAQAMPTPAAAAAAPRNEQIQLASLSPNALTLDTPDSSLVPATSLPMSAAIPLKMVPLPTPAPGVPPPSPAQRLKLEGKEYAKAERCLANAIYFEARSEPVRGQMAVAQVVVNRAFSGFYPNDICGVVYQNAHRHLSCQFTFACDGKSKAITERGHWARANRIAKQTLEGQIYVPEVAKSTHYHAVYVHPNWVREMKKQVRYGLHTFYRPYAWGNGDEEPVWGSPALLASAKKK